MKLFSTLYNKMIIWSGHPKAVYYLAGVSFAESSFFPIPPDVMLISMGLATPRKSWYYALLTTVFSILGGLLGYTLGYACMEYILPVISHSSLNVYYLKIEQWMRIHGVIITLIAGFSPFPYKLFTLAAGALAMPVIPFVIASFISRGARF